MIVTGMISKLHLRDLGPGFTGQAIIVYTLPLWLCRGGLTDFVLNAFATVYIVELDDLTSRDEWRLLEDGVTNAKSFSSSEDSA
jgi:hypothetical protein